jgi:pyruvate kinase
MDSLPQVQNHRKARIFATIGPASTSPEVLERMLQAGMTVARLNFSHGSHEQHAANIRTLRDVAARLRTPLGILMDLQGPKIRVGDFSPPLTLSVGESVCLYDQSTARPERSEKCIPVDFRELFEVVDAGNRLLLDDGKLALTVSSVGTGSLLAVVRVGGTLSAHKGINLPGVPLPIPAFTDKDRADLEFGLAQGVDAVAISFVRSPADVTQVRAALERALPAGVRPPLLIAKLERPEALDNLDAILDAVDGVMVARGDLGVELPPEEVPALQKRIIRAANAKARLVITATQMLETMIHNPLPTRAEASDVANAVFDGTDAVMLSAETASGENPVEAVAMMDRIVREAEAHFAEWGHGGGHGLEALEDAGSVAHAARELARDRDVAAIAVFTIAGNSAWAVSKARPDVPILALTPELKTYNRLAFLWGVRPFVVPFARSLEHMLTSLEEVAARESLLRPGQQVVVVCSFPVGEVRPPNMALLHTIPSQN